MKITLIILAQHIQKLIIQSVCIVTLRFFPTRHDKNIVAEKIIQLVTMIDTLKNFGREANTLYNSFNNKSHQP
jgi:hypothetical protein